MRKNNCMNLAIAMAAVLLSACMGTTPQPEPMPMQKLIDEQFSFAASQYKELMKHTVKDSMPRTWYELEQKFRSDDIKSWISGFYPATLLYIYEYTGDKVLFEEAKERLKLQEPIRHFKEHHDLGFMIFCPFGNAYRITGDAQYKEVIRDGAAALSTRFRPQIGSIQSWDSSKNFKCPVIIDNMMNLELLLWAAENGGDPKWKEIAITHANSTLQNHFRADNSTWHVLDYSLATGKLERRVTWQGMADSSAWARGQAWGLYGFTVMYRFTKDERYLQQAHKVASFMLNHPNLPKDKIPYWDYDAKGDISVLRDASAGAILASALVELATYSTEDIKNQYIQSAETIIRSLASSKYRASIGENGGFLLKHSVGALPLHNEIDVPLTYADYYWLEAMLRYKQVVIEGKN